MNFAPLIYRFRWLHLPTTLLAMLLQRTPVLRVLAIDGPGFAIRSTDILKSAFALATLGAYNSLSGATTFSATVVSPTTVTPATVVKPSSGPFVVSSPANSAFSFAVNVTGAPSTAKSWKVTGTLPAGVTIAGSTVSGTSFIFNGLKVTLAGTPTAGYTGNLTIAAYDTTGATGNTTSVNCTLTITAPPLFTTQPLAQTVTVGGGVTFTAAASGTPAPTFQWFKGTTALSGKTAATLSLTNVQLADAGDYKVVATNSAAPSGVSSSLATLTVNPAAVAPSFTTQPLSQTVTEGGAVTFTAAASGTPAPTFQWFKGTTVLSGKTAATLGLTNVQLADAGDYKVVATNSAAPSGVSSNLATLTVNPATVAPTFSLHPAPRTVIAGTSVTLSVAAGGTPAPTLQWMKGTTALSGQTATTLTLANVQPADAGDYKAVATNSAAPGGVSSNLATLVVVPVPSAAIRLAPGARQIDVPSLSGYSYELQGAPNLTGGVWTVIGSAQTGNGATLTFSDGASGVSFYRVAITSVAP